MPSDRHQDQLPRSTARSHLAPLCGVAAVLGLLIAGSVPAVAQSSLDSVAVPTAAPSFQIYNSHIAWRNDCVDKRSAGASGPDYTIYRSHVAWRDTEVSPSASTMTQSWELFGSHVTHRDECSLHPIVASTPVPSYAWHDVVHAFSG